MKKLKKCNNNEESSYKNTETTLRNACFSPKKPSAQFRQRLFMELKNNLSSQTPMEPLQQKGRFWSFFNPQLAPVMLSLAAIGVALAGISGVLKFRQTTPHAPKAPQLVINEPLTNEQLANAFSLKALEETATGISTSTVFELTSRIATTAEKIKEVLSFSPQVAYALETTSENTYLLTPSTSLPEGELITAQLKLASTQTDGTTVQRLFSWSYQVQEQFQIRSTLPRDRATFVPVDTGIEITFSHNDPEGVSEHFSITPEIKGRFEIHRKTVSFVPEQPLSSETLYTIKLTNGVKLAETGETINQDTFFRFETASNNPEQSIDPGIESFREVTNETSTSKAPSFIVSGWNLEGMKTTALSLYTFPSEESFRNALQAYISEPTWLIYSRNSWNIDASTLSLHSTTEVPLEDIGNGWEYVITAPSPLEEGFYLAQISGRENKNKQALLQVTNINAYVTTSATDTLVWAHDASTEQPLRSATISTLNAELAITDENGMAKFSTPPEFLPEAVATFPYFILRAANKTLYLPLINSDYRPREMGGEREGSGLASWSYLYLDQPYYYPADTANFWGVLQARDGDSYSKAKMQIRTSSWDNLEPLYEQPITTGKFGTFEGSFVLGNLLPGDYEAALVVDGKTLFYKYFQVLTQQKPTYTISVQPENIGVISGDSYTHTIKAEFFEGTPVANLALNIGKGPFTTNEAGIATYTSEYSTDRYDQTQGIDVYPAEGEESEIFGTARVRVFPSSERFMPLEVEQKDLTATARGQLRHLDLEGFNNGLFEFDENPVGGVIANKKISAKATRYWYTSEQNGTDYDFLQKKSIPRYQYIEHEEEAFKQELTTDANGEFNFTFNVVNDSRYIISVETKDDQGRVTSIESWLWTEANDNHYYSSGDYFHLDIKSLDQKDQFSVGDNVDVEFLNNDTILEQKGSFLFIQARNGLRASTVTSEPKYSFTFNEEHIPNIILVAVWYDGRSYWGTDATGSWMDPATDASFNEKDREINISVIADKDAYQPGEEVRMNIITARPDDSKTSAVVNINLVDEAMYALLPEGSMFGFSRDYTTDFNTIFYRDAEAGIFASYASHRYPRNFSGAEGGGGGDTRKWFPNKALFKTVTTDENGEAQITFKLPDNLTSWRMNMHAIDRENYAGNDISKLIVRQPFFVTATISPTYLVADQPQISVRAYGTDLKSGDEVTFTVSSESLGMNEQKITVHESESATVSLPVLKEGEQKIIIKGETQNGQLADALERSFKVVFSRVAVTEAKVEEIREGWVPQVDTDRPFTLTLLDEYKGKFYLVLNSGLNTWGNRLDQLASRVIAAELLKEYFGMEVEQENFTAEEYQLSDKKALTLFPYSDADLELSAHIAASPIAERFDTAQLAQYFNDVLNDSTLTTDNHALALYGLASLHEPVLLEIRTILQSDKITDKDRLLLSLALAELGAYEEAKQLFENLMNNYAKEISTLTELTLGENTDEILTNTLYAATIAAIIQDSHADSLFNYVQEKRPQETVLDLISMNFISSRLRVLPQTNTIITYNHLDEEKNVELANGQTYLIPLTVETAKNFSIIKVEGKASALIISERPATAAELYSGSGLTIERRYEKTTLNNGDLVRITLTANIPNDLPDTSYEITDLLPSGLQVVTQPGKYGDYNSEDLFSRPFRIDGQRVSLSVSRGYNTVSYYARATQKGTFTAELAIINNAETPGIRSAGGDEIINIK